MAAKEKEKEPDFDPHRAIFSADWFINDVELPTALPAPVASPHDLCKKAASTIKRHTKVRSGDDKLLIHWALGDCGLVVQGGDYLKVLLKASYRLTEAEVAAGTVRARERSSSNTSSPVLGHASSLMGRVLGTSPAPSSARSAHADAEAPASAPTVGRSRSGNRKGKAAKASTYAWSQSAQRTVRFFTRERRIYVQQHVSGMSAKVRDAERGKGKVYVDCHLAGDYAIELEEQALESAAAQLAAGQGTQRSSYVVNSLTLRFDKSELLTELRKLTADGATASVGARGAEAAGTRWAHGGCAHGVPAFRMAMTSLRVATPQGSPRPT